jgi:spore maturation protein CgeB
MKLVIFGLTVSSSWGNGHATLWRGLIGALARRGHEVHFFERDVAYYANQRDLTQLPGAYLHLYSEWEDAREVAWRHLMDADASMVTSYCPDALAAEELAFDSPAPLKTFYDLDTPVTLSRLDSGERVDYIGPRGFRDYDLVLSYTGGKALTELETRLGARNTAPLYGHVDPAVHRPVEAVERYRADLSYLGTYAADRQLGVQDFFIEPARLLPDMRFCLGGAMYPQDFPWTSNIFFVYHLPPGEHPAFFCSSRLTLNVTRKAMAEMGYCPSGRLFEAAACGVPILSDWWEGLDQFFEPRSEILVARTTGDAVAALRLGDEDIARISRSARERTLDEHTSDVRARELETIFERSRGSASVAEVCGDVGHHSRSGRR